MKQILQHLESGENIIVEAPAPQNKREHLLIATHKTLISAGTERMLLNFSKASYLQKAKQQPDKVKQVLDKVKTDGLVTTYEAVKSKLAEPIPLGYCNVGSVLEVGAGCDGFAIGDRVISNGPHADVVRVGKHLCAKVPDNVSDEQAAFTVLSSIALQGIRLTAPTLGESVVVTGAGLIGLIAIQLLRASGCRVLAIDFDDAKLELARQFGATTCNPAKGEDPVEAGISFSRGRGVDAVLITASTKSSEPVSQAAQMSRKRGRIVLVGVTGLELNRAEFYEKELSFQVSCSYGPGRYEADYEEKGQDYPLGFVRWTEQRNFEAVLDMMSSRQLDVKPLISHRFAFEEAQQAYQVLTDEPNALGIVLDYATSAPQTRLSRQVTLKSDVSFDSDKPVVGMIGAGNYASRMLIPAFKDAGAQLHTLATSGGISAVVHGEKGDFAHASTDTEAMLKNPDINTVAIVTRHNSHAHFVTKALTQGKNVFVEKPLALTHNELDEIESAYGEGNARVMVGFNRRFAPQVQKMKALLDSSTAPKAFNFTVNAGAIPADHWTQDQDVGGGRILGEACHFIDLMRFLSGSDIVAFQASCAADNSGHAVDDISIITLTFKDGSVGSIHYLANGANAFPKERLEVFCAGKILQLDNFRQLKGYGFKGFNTMKLWQQDKGHKACAQAFLSSIEHGQPCPISFAELMEVSRITVDIAQQLRAGR
ncbi:bi-domain-containing oxidoreductase [Aestuariibacter salexigens]|uniref:bi-domain-containing oxidoreductase n=1 Tax=Aestuariibacter salexigens TaxID=226010 RepID=UPI0004144195|nr:bi-domain-containing oxidoreductase [Aestuariibacter salexigens]